MKFIYNPVRPDAETLRHFREHWLPESSVSTIGS